MANGKTGKAGKVISIILKVFAWIIVAATVCIMVFTIMSNTFDKQDGKSLLGYKFLSVLSDSMSPSDKNAHMDVHFTTEDIVIIKEMKDATKDGREYVKGDIIAFNTEKEIDGKLQMVTVTHMVSEVVLNDQGVVVGYKTMGTNTMSLDQGMVETTYVLGEYVGKLPKANTFLGYLKTVPGYIVCILIPFLLLIGYNGMNCIMLFRKYKREQMEELEAEKTRVDNERRETLEMLKELAALKAQIAQQAAAPAASATATPVEAPVEAVVDETVNEESIAEKVATAAESEEAAEEVAIEDNAISEEVHETEASEEEPAEVEAPAEEAPAVEEATAEEAPAVEEAPVEEKPAETGFEDAIEAEKRKNAEMMKELESLKAQIALEEEKQKNEQMMRELEALKAQLASKKSENN